MDGVDLVPPHPEPTVEELAWEGLVPPQPEPTVQELAWEARRKASYQATLNCFLGQ